MVRIRNIRDRDFSGSLIYLIATYVKMVCRIKMAWYRWTVSIHIPYHFYYLQTNQYLSIYQTHMYLQIICVLNWMCSKIFYSIMLCIANLPVCWLKLMYYSYLILYNEMNIRYICWSSWGPFNIHNMWLYV